MIIVLEKYNSLHPKLSLFLIFTLEILLRRYITYSTVSKKLNPRKCVLRKTWINNK